MFYCALSSFALRDLGYVQPGCPGGFLPRIFLSSLQVWVYLVLSDRLSLRRPGLCVFLCTLSDFALKGLRLCKSLEISWLYVSRFSQVHFKSKYTLVLCDLLSLMRYGHCVYVLCRVFCPSVIGCVEAWGSCECISYDFPKFTSSLSQS